MANAARKVTNIANKPVFLECSEVQSFLILPPEDFFYHFTDSPTHDEYKKRDNVGQGPSEEKGFKCICHSEPNRGMKMKITDFDENWCD